MLQKGANTKQASFKRPFGHSVLLTGLGLLLFSKPKTF